MRSLQAADGEAASTAEKGQLFSFLFQYFPIISLIAYTESVNGFAFGIVTLLFPFIVPHKTHLSLRAYSLYGEVFVCERVLKWD